MPRDDMIQLWWFWASKSICMHHVLFWGGFFGIQIELKIWILPTRHKNIKEMDRANWQRVQFHVAAAYCQKRNGNFYVQVISSSNNLPMICADELTLAGLVLLHFDVIFVFGGCNWWHIYEIYHTMYKY